MEIFFIVVASLIALCGWALSLAGISGTWLILISTVGLDILLDWSWDNWIPAIIFLFFCVAAEVAELASGLLGAKALGGSRSSQAGAFLGTLGGAIIGSLLIPIPVVGTIIGVLGGGFAGALLGELRHQRGQSAPPDDSSGVKSGLKAGVGAMVARIVTIVIKATLSTLMAGWFVWVVISHFIDR